MNYAGKALVYITQSNTLQDENIRGIQFSDVAWTD